MVEIVIVIGIMGIIITGVLPLFVNTVSANKEAELNSTAYRLLDSKLEEYRRLPFDDIESTATPFTVAELPNGEGNLVVSNVIEGASQPDIKQLTLTLTWNYKRSKTIKISTFVTRGGISQ